MPGASQNDTFRRALHVTLVVIGFFAVWQFGVMLAKPPTTA